MQSFSPEENITPELAHEVALRLAEFYKDFEVLVATHVDRDHIHSHFIVNSVSVETGKKLHQNGNTIKELRKFSDDLCREFGLSVCQPKQEKEEPVSGKEYHSAVRGDRKKSWSMQLIGTIDRNLTKRFLRIPCRRLEGGTRGKLVSSVRLVPLLRRATEIFGSQAENKPWDMMELEFGIREQIVARGIEEIEPSRATTKVTSTPKQHTTYSTTVDTDSRGLGDDFGEPENSLGQDGGTSESNQQPSADHEDSTRTDFHQKTSGGTDQTSGEDSEDTRTGWEKEREEVFSSKTHSTRSASRVSRADDGISSDLLYDLVQLGKGLESVGEEPIEDCTTNPQAKHIDRKRLEK